MFYLMIQTALLMLIAMLIGGALVWYFCCRRRAQDNVDRRSNDEQQNGASTSAYAAAPSVAAAAVTSEPEADEVKAATAAPVVEASSDASDSGIVELSITATADEKDDLQRIYGIGPKLERLLNSMGVYTFEQIANFTEQDIARVDARLEAFKGRIVRDNWMKSARELLDRGNA
ncbi:MAG: hypothetical protein HWE20_03745 [Gammaproteobacteria bacterium]|nr:hypothetical protein [Gammaproteobacteria bacterium]